MAYGFVYVLFNRTMPGLVKIGCTERSPHQRAHELSKATGVPQPFQVALYAEFADMQAAESRLHRVLQDRRHHQRREFFSIGPAEFQAAFEQAFGAGSPQRPLAISTGFAAVLLDAGAEK